MGPFSERLKLANQLLPKAKAAATNSLSSDSQKELFKAQQKRLDKDIKDLPRSIRAALTEYTLESYCASVKKPSP